MSDLHPLETLLPCQREPDLFTSDSPEERAQAALACRMCPALTACHALAEANQETWHVWGGIDRTGLASKTTNKEH